MIKALLKNTAQRFGYEIKRKQQPAVSADARPVGDMKSLLEDLKRRGLNCSFIIDVGANCTNWSRMAKEVFPGAHFCLIEPQEEMLQSLEEFCNADKNSFFVAAGAGARNEVKLLTVWDDLLGSSFLPAMDENLKQVNKQREISICTIDSLIKDKQAPDLIKLDIQGFELEALKGAESTFGKTEVYILEVSLYAFDTDMPVFAEVVNFMLERDYVVYDFPGFLRRPYDGALGQCDICFVKKDSFLRSSNSWV